MQHTGLQSHEYYMRLLIQLAKKNPRAPFAAMIVDAQSGEILSKGLNNSKVNPTEHGEVVAINNYARLHPSRPYKNTILYTTAESCPMCMSAIVWARISLTVYGTSIPFLIESGWGQITIRSNEVVNNASSFYKGRVIGGVLKEFTDPLFANGPGK
ncbi:MAG: nucleoside deaminase [Saprospiraceae bacterium]|nr:nucleoside deaminase [Saprospiraceae bacterium]